MATKSGLRASRPLATNVAAGDLYFSTDGIYLSRSTGLHWEDYGPLMKLKPPPLVADFTLINQGTSTFTDCASGLDVFMPTNVGEGSSLAVQAKPAVAYELTACFQPCWFSGNDAGAGLVLRDSVTGKFVTFLCLSGGNLQVLDVRNMDSPTVFNSNSPNLLADIYSMSPLWLRITDDLTTRHYFVSPDGNQWLEIGVGEPSGNFITPDQIGFCVWCLNGFSKFNLISYEVK